MTQCLACVSGVPSASGTPSPGYHLLSISDANTLKSGCSATYKPTLTTNCSMSNTLLSVFVDYVSGGGGRAGVWLSGRVAWPQLGPCWCGDAWPLLGLCCAGPRPPFSLGRSLSPAPA